MNQSTASTANLDRDARRQINNLSRGDIERALNWAGYATYDHESTDDLRACLAQSVADGEIDLELVVL